jgi:hypothetical protein
MNAPRVFFLAYLQKEIFGAKTLGSFNKRTNIYHIWTDTWPESLGMAGCKP